jgi:hypothetical protein
MAISRHLLHAFDRDVLDAAIVRREDDCRDGEVPAQERFGWLRRRDSTTGRAMYFALPRWRHPAVCAMRRRVRSTPQA